MKDITKDKIRDWWSRGWGDFIGLVVVIIVVVVVCRVFTGWMDTRDVKSCDEYVATLDLLGHSFVHRHEPRDCQILVVHQEGDDLFYIWVDRYDFEHSLQEQAAGLK